MGTLRPWRERYLVFGAPFIGPEEREEVLACIDGGWLGSGPRVERFQEAFRAYVGAAAAVAVNSGSAALHLALLRLGLAPGDEVITSPTKNITTVEGGMVTCRDAAAAEALMVMALHGMSKDAWHRYRDDGFVHYEVTAPGFKYNLTDLAAAFGIHQLSRVEASWRRRRVLWDYYLEALRGLPLILPAPVPPTVRHAHHLFTCLVDDARTSRTRDQVVAGLHALRIGAGVQYRPLHLHAYYRRVYGYRQGAHPNAEWIGERTFSLPLSAAVTDDDAADVVRALRTVLDS